MKKKVAVIHPEAGFSSSGGSQLSAYEMAEHLATFFDVKLFLTARNQQSAKGNFVSFK